MTGTLPSAEAAVKIRAEPSVIDPHACKFAVSRTVHPGGPFLFDRKERGAGSPLIESLFALAGVQTVLVSDNVVTVWKEPGANWAQLLKPIGAALRAHLLTGVPCIVETSPALTAGDRSDEELTGAIQALLDREINPGIASHGGSIHVERVQQGALFIRMEGGCQGCAASTLTLRQGVEGVVLKAFREIKQIVDVTDHAAGANPYYTTTM